MSKELVHKDLSESIIGAAMTVLNMLKPGLDEKLYERALVIELRKRGHRVEQQKEFPVYYDEQHIGTLIPDLIVDNLVIADPKVVTAFHPHSPDARLPQHHRPETCPAAKLQECQTRMETHRQLNPNPCHP